MSQYIKTISIAILALFMGLAQQSVAQLNNNSVTGQQNQLRTITTAVPFLIIGPDTRAGGMGEAGVATSADANSIHWNPAKLAFAESPMEVSLSYSPWLRKLVRDMNLAYLSGYKRLDDNQTVGASLRFFSLGSIQFTDAQGQDLLSFEPSEFAVDGAYAIKLSEKFSGGMAARFIYSNLTGSITTNSGAASKPGVSFGVDVSAYYQNEDIRLGDFDAVLSAGLNISNIGSKIAYTNAAERDFIPINMRLGPALKLLLDDYNSLTFTVDANKLLVPSVPLFNDSNEIAAGRDPDVGVAAGIFGSFSDAPGFATLDNGVPVVNADGTFAIESGSVLREELREINYAAGFEYWYLDQFALRGGYFYEHPTKGNRKFFTLGAGLKFNFISADFSYLIAAQQRNPLANTLRVTLKLTLDGKSAGSSTDE